MLYVSVLHAGLVGREIEKRKLTDMECSCHCPQAAGDYVLFHVCCGQQRVFVLKRLSRGALVPQTLHGMVTLRFECLTAF